MEKVQNFLFYAYFPLLHLYDESPLSLGPLVLSPYIQAKTKLTLEEIDTVENFARSNHIASNGVCMFIDPAIAKENMIPLLTDAVYLLYFSIIFQQSYAHLPLDELKSFAIYPIEEIERNRTSRPLYFFKIQEIHLKAISTEIFIGLGKALTIIYHPTSEESEDKTVALKRMITAIHYFIDSISPLNEIFPFSPKAFESQALILLEISFEALFDISSSNPGPELKQKIRPMLHLEFSRPVEIFWKWVDGFYSLCHQILHQNKQPDYLFTENGNFEIPYYVLGNKLFIYSIYYKLFAYQLITAMEDNPFIPPHFQDIQPEEILLFLWPEENLLKKISIILMQCVHAEDQSHQKELLSEARLLIKIFILLFSRYYANPSTKDHTQSVQFKSLQIPFITDYINTILALSEENIQFEDRVIPLIELIPCNLLPILKSRLRMHNEELALKSHPLS